MNKVLTPELVLARAKTDSLYGIRNLNVWGNDLSDVSIIRKLPNVEVLSLSVNKIASLKDFSSCLKLQELYLRKNSISDLSEIRYLANLPELRVLWLSDNSCTEVPNYREIVISILPGLTKLDNQPISSEEKANARKLGISLDDLAGPLPQKEEPQRSEYPSSKPQKKQNSYDYPEPENNVYEEKNVRGYQQEPPQKKNSHAGGPKKCKEAEAQQDYESKPLRELPQNESENYNTPSYQQPTSSTRNDNIVCAIMTLIKELDGASLEVLKSSIDKRLYQIKGNQERY